MLTLFGSTATTWQEYLLWYNGVSFHRTGNATLLQEALRVAKAALGACVVGDLDDVPGTLELLRCVLAFCPLAATTDVRTCPLVWPSCWCCCFCYSA